MRDFFQKYFSIISFLAFLPSIWAVDEIDICLQHDKGEGCMKLCIQVPNVQDGRNLVESDRFYNNLIDTGSVISLSDNEERLHLISTKMAQRDDERNFFRYDTIKFDNDESKTILPVLYNLGYVKEDDSTIEVYIFPFTSGKSGVVSFQKSDNAQKDHYSMIEGHYYRHPFGEYEPTSFSRKDPLSKDKVKDFRIQSIDRKIQGFSTKSTQELTYIRNMPFSNEVSVFGTVWNVRHLWKNTLTDITPTLFDWRPLTVFPIMSEEQYSGVGLNKKEIYKDNFDNAFFYDDLLCFFPTKPDNESHYQAFTSRSLDIVAHETGHYILSVIAPNIANNPGLYAGAFNESFADCTAYFFLLQFSSMRHLIYKRTGGDLNVSSFFSVIGEGLTGRDATSPSTPLADTDCERYALSENMTKAIYGILLKNTKDQFEAYKREENSKNIGKLFCRALEEESSLLMKIYAHAILEYERYYNSAEDFDFFDFGQEMLKSVDTFSMISSNNKFFIKASIEKSFEEQGINGQSPQTCSLSPRQERGNGAKCATLSIRYN